MSASPVLLAKARELARVAWSIPLVRRHLWLSVAMLLLLSGSILFAYSDPSQGQGSSWLERILTPQTVITLVVVLMYLGGVRQELIEVQREVKALKAWRDELPSALDERFMPREALEARLAAAGAGAAGLVRPSHQE